MELDEDEDSEIAASFCRLFLPFIRSAESDCGFCPAEAVAVLVAVLASVAVVIEGFETLLPLDLELRVVPSSWDSDRGGGPGSPLP